MRNRVTIVDRKFKTNKEKNTVVCIMKCQINFPEDLEAPYLPNKVYHKLQKILGAKYHYLPFFVIGTSKCHSEDTFDEVIGKRIAESRAKKEAYEKATLVWREIGLYYHSLWAHCTKLYNACSSAKKIEKEHIDKLIQ